MQSPPPAVDWDALATDAVMDKRTHDAIVAFVGLPGKKSVKEDDRCRDRQLWQLELLANLL